MSVADIEKLTAFCRANNIRRIKTADVEMEFGAPDASDAMMKKFQRFIEQGQPTDDETLNWSAPGYDPSHTQGGPAPKPPQNARGRRS